MPATAGAAADTAAVGATTGAAPAASQAQAEKAPQRVRVATLRAEKIVDDIVVNGQTEASRKVTLLAETEGQVVEVHAEKGAFVAEGAVLARVEVKDRKANLSKAKRAVEQRKIEYDAAHALAAKGYSSEVRLATTKAELEAAKAALRQAEIDLANITVKAPFDGVVEERAVEIGTYLERGKPVATIVDLDPVKISGFVSERRVSALKAGSKAFALLPDGREVEGRISFISASGETATRTFRVEVEVQNPDRSIVEGLTARLRLPVAETLAHRVSPAILSLSDAGVVGVKTVNILDEVEFVPVTILADRTDATWIEGLPEVVRVITVGQDFVAAGQKVEPVETVAPVEAIGTVGTTEPALPEENPSSGE